MLDYYNVGVEVFKPIEGYSGYEISNLGRVRSFWKRIGYVRFAIGTTSRFLKLQPCPSGHLRVKLSHPETGKKRFMVHVLVLEHFVGPCPEGMECRHLDGNATNNDVDNLAWGTKRQNMDDMVKHGKHQRGETHNKAKLTDDQVREMRRLWDYDGLSAKQLGDRFGITSVQARDVCKRRFWKHVKD